MREGIKMEKIRFYCKCGYTTEETGYLEDVEDMKICPLCETPMNIEEEKEKTDNLLYGAIKEEAITSMKNAIQKISNKRCWEILEGFRNAKTRMAYREIFFKAGGVVPESEI